MPTQKLTSTPGFVLFDLPGAATSTGPVRLAPKVLASSSADLARTITYAHALVGQEIGGAAAGLDAAADARDGALTAFLEEVRPLVEAGTFLPDPGRGVGEADLAPLRALDRRTPDCWADPVAGSTPRDRAVAAGAAACAAAATGGLDGRSVALDGLSGAALAFAELVVAAGARIVAVTVKEGSVRDDAGLDPAALRAAFTDGGGAAVAAIGPASETPAAGSGADILAATAPVGAYDHTAASGIATGVLVPLAPLVCTARGMAVLGRAGTAVLPDFLTMAGDALAATAPALDDAGISAIGERVRAIADGLAADPSGWFLAASSRAEAFLATWQETLPFGRPLAP